MDQASEGALVNSSELKPSRAYYALAACIFIGGIGMFGVTLWKGLSGMGAKLQQIVAPGRSDITLAAPGDYTIFYEHDSVVGNRVYSTGEGVPGLECTLASKATGAQVSLQRSGANTTYSFGGRSGKSVFDFHIDQPGVYELSSGYASGSEGQEVVLAVGQGVTESIVATVFGGLAILFGSIALSIIIVVVTGIKRHNSKKRLQTASNIPPPIE
jgi:hypothetical protein